MTKQSITVLCALPLFLFLVAATGYSGTAVTGKTPADLTGVWKGTSNSVAIGTLGHTEASQTPKFLHADFTLTIDKQEGPTFSGTKASAKATETLLGAVDGQSVYMVDDDGVYLGTLTDKNTMAVRYMEATPQSRVVSITIYHRESTAAKAAK